MKGKNKILILSLSIAMIMGLITGCAGSSEKVNNENIAAAEENHDTETTAFENSASEDADKTPSLAGQVTAIDGNNITLSLFSGKGMQNGDGRPEGGRPNPSDNTAGGDTASEGGDTASDATVSEGTEAKPGAPSSDIIPNGTNTGEAEEKVITITDDTAISVEDGDTAKDGTIDDITVGCMLSISYTSDEAGNEVLSSVTVRSFSGGPGEQGRANINQSTDATTSADDNN